MCCFYLSHKKNARINRTTVTDWQNADHKDSNCSQVWDYFPYSTSGTSGAFAEAIVCPNFEKPEGSGPYKVCVHKVQ